MRPADYVDARKITEILPGFISSSKSSFIIVPVFRWFRHMLRQVHVPTFVERNGGRSSGKKQTPKPGTYFREETMITVKFLHRHFLHVLL
jgi:UPF0716 family protein affecting phage T7 exclusion